MKKHVSLWLLASLLCTSAVGVYAQETVKRKPGGASLVQLEDGRKGSGNLIAATGMRGFIKPATANAYALIMTIGDYQGNIPKLKGVPFDTATATEIAKRMGVPVANITAMKDGELTLDGMRKAFDDLEAKLGGNDQVFIYYSGHGGRQVLPDENGGERCAESLITVDGQGFSDSEMEQRLKRLSLKSQKTIVFLDACHSGGVTTRAVDAANAAYVPKTYTPPGQNCAKPTNVLTRSIVLSKAPGAGGGNFVHIAAARADEVSFDQPSKGGLASLAWLACLAGEAKDRDGSGGLSAAEIQTCAQERIDAQLKNAQGILPPHVAINGNPNMVLSYAAKEEPAPATATALAPAPVVQVAPSALAALTDIYNNRDDRRLITMTAPKSTLKIGKDTIDFTLTSREGGYVYLLMVGSDGKSFDLLFPNTLDQANVMEPGGTIRLPRKEWKLTVEGPVGKDTLLAIVTDSPRNFAAAGLKPSGPFSAIEAVAAKDIQLVTSSAAGEVDSQCANGQAKRNLTIRKQCSLGYAAAMLTLEEVR